MEKLELKEATYLYNTLIEHGVVFYYGSEIISHGEITEIEFIDDDKVKLELDGFEEYEVNLEDFIEYHSKQGLNYHCFETARKLDALLSQIN